ncbi:YccF domain-containing protein [Acinetobacter terrestris]|uniref:hypothetical protein n=1 Tax=Acinetobacter terrestris TaxID=2529843 RepID=UPI001D186A12|nr:hypothetical protein [Acinetobacter terrestris]
MAEQEGKQALMIQLPWTVPQQPNVQTIVLQQPAKTQMELNASTDKTAISSFALSVIIALILGGFATWLAYWYGRKSFKLTEMSFKIVSEDIKQAAETNRQTTMVIIQSQAEISKLEFSFKEKTELRNRIIERSGEFLGPQSKFIIEIYKYGQHDKPISTDHLQRLCNDLNELNREILSQYHMLLLTVDDLDKTYERVKFVGNIFLQVAWDSVRQIKEDIKISNLYPNNDIAEKIGRNLKEKSIFTKDELEKLKYFNGSTYQILTTTNSFLQNELRNLIKRIKAA